MKIGFVAVHASPLGQVGRPDTGGQTVHVAELAKMLARCGHQVTVYTRRDSPTLPDKVLIGSGVTVEHVAAGPPAGLVKDKLLPHMPAFGAFLADRWLREPPDIVHAHSWLSGLAALTGVRDLDIPVVQTFHALGVVRKRHQGPGDTSPAARIRLEVAIARGVNTVIATCSDEAFELARLGVPRTTITVVPSGVDVHQFTQDGKVAIRGEQPRLLAVGRLVKRKGLDDIIRALPGIPDAELVIAGGAPRAQLRHDGEYRRLMRIADTSHVSGRVKFLGRVSRDAMPALMRSADLLVSVPWYEPFGLAPLEAMACGTPVVASAVGGHTDTIVDGTTGVLVPPKEPEVLARRIRDLLSGPILLDGYGIAAADRARARYSWERICQETLVAYERARGIRAARRPAGAARRVSGGGDRQPVREVGRSG